MPNGSRRCGHAPKTLVQNKEPKGVKNEFPLGGPGYSLSLCLSLSLCFSLCVAHCEKCQTIRGVCAENATQKACSFYLRSNDDNSVLGMQFAALNHRPIMSRSGSCTFYVGDWMASALTGHQWQHAALWHGRQGDRSNSEYPKQVRVPLNQLEI